MSWFVSRGMQISVLGTVCASLMFGLFVMSVRAVAEEKRADLTILNWSEYMDPAIIEAFEKKRGVKIKEIYFESDDARDQIMLQTEGKGYDLIVANGVTINTYRKRDWLQPIPTSHIPNLVHLEKRWIDAFDSTREYGVPYLWGTLGIAYRKDLVKEPITSWKQLYQPSKELHGKILMVKSSRDIIGMALKALGYSCNSNDPEELRQAGVLALSQKPYVARYGYISLGDDSALVSGQIVAATVYGGDALNVGEYNENIAYVLPSEGGNIWVDYFALSSKAGNKELAVEFLNFLNEPKIAAQNAEEIYLATPNAAAKKLLPAEILNNPVIYPDKDVLSRSEFYKELSPSSIRDRASIFARLVR